MSKTIIELHDIRRDFQVGDETVHALRGVSFSIHEGEFVTIMGTSGSGKSTLLNTLGCLDTPTSGEYLLDGTSVRTMSKPQRAVLRNRKIGFVFQNYNLLPKTTAVENVELPLMYNPSVSAAERRRRAIDALMAVGLGDRLEHKSNQMSGGQMQRVAIARALVNNPSKSCTARDAPSSSSPTTPTSPNTAAATSACATATSSKTRRIPASSRPPRHWPRCRRTLTTKLMKNEE